ncbi:uncharacterized protein LOC126833905 [Adelges cooleyi]|uniref:uncharacterized protein LOC126833905 n=1 Tax=Adelges cooleyi TaxID=133065 RepID=UPI00218054FD|nr:uncharacterized protein LOC126833905 [Adelges cooleyi]
MASISYYFIVLSVCVVCTFASVGKFDRDDLLIYKETDDEAFMMFAEQDNVNPQHKDTKIYKHHVNLDPFLVIKPDFESLAYVDVIYKLHELKILGDEKFGKQIVFNTSGLLFDNIFIKEE